jgi:anti-anti-sigma regulatory factor
MGIRIDIESDGYEVVYHIAGRLSGRLEIAQVEEVCESIEGSCVLDLSKLMFADDAGAEAIRILCERGAEIRGASSFIKLLING